MPYTDQSIVVGSTIDFVLFAQKDGIVWDITGAVVRLYLRSPAKVWSSSYAATVSDGPTGKAHYQVTSSVLSTAGDWQRHWVIEKDGLTLRSEPVTFSVLPFLLS
jgi:hypothetical protein